jgi:hypothetical protein
MAVNVPRYQNPGAPGVLLGTNGDDHYQGGAGYDAAQFDAGRRGSTILNDANGPVSVSGAGLDSLNSVETLIFIDGREVYNPEDHAAQVTRLYDNVLGRNADQTGLNYYINAMDDGTSMTDIAAQMLNSDEFSASFGAGQTNTQFVQTLYNNLRGENGSDADVSYWTGRLDSGDLDLGDVAMLFANSDEALANGASTLASGIWDRDESAISIANLYDATFDRAPDQAGLTYWINEIHSQSVSMQEIAQRFYDGGEAQNALASLNDADFVNAIYQNALDRPADESGLASYTSELASGNFSRSDVILSISDSPEHQAITADAFQSDNPLSYGVSLVG